MPATPRRAFIVSHTHWDREWYLSFHRFRVKLVDVVGQVLDRLESDPDYEHYVLDGQAIVLEDYLEVRPEDASRIARLVADGRLSLGPWYVLPDEFLISGEAHLRNLAYGRRVSRAHGGVQSAGYMPDSFGHIAQMPQILARSGIKSFIYTRGNGDEIDRLGYEYTWRAPDGSEVLAINQPGGYCNAGGLGHEELWHAHTRREIDPERAVEQVGELFEKAAERTNSDAMLIMNGCDHFPPQKEFGRVVRALREAFPETEFRHTGFEEYLEAVRESAGDLETFTGELRGGRLHLILSGVWSARMYLKQENEAAQEALAGVLEPVLTYTRFAHGRPYPSGQVDYAWKLLLSNHPHDSICGCSTDEVHRDMMPRFAGVRETADQLLTEEIDHLTPMFGRRAEDDRATVITLVNPHPERRTEVVERMVVLRPISGDPDELELRDEADRPIPYEVLDQRRVERFWGIDYRAALSQKEQTAAFRVYLERFGERIQKADPEPGEDGRRPDCHLHVRFLAEDLPAVGHTVVSFAPREGEPLPVAGPVRADGDTVENGVVRVHLRGNGIFDLKDLRTGRTWTGLNLLEDEGDVGDEYDFSPSPCGAVVTSEGAAGTVRGVDPGTLAGTVRVVDPGTLAGALEATFVLPLPRGAGDTRTARRPEVVPCPVRVRVGLTGTSPVVDVETIIDNRAEDHRLRAVFPTGIRADEFVTDGHFLLDHRSLERPEGRGWMQPPPGTAPQQEFSLVTDGDTGLAVLNRGLPEIEGSRDADGSARLSLTLLRSVGWLSRDDFASRNRQNAGPTVFTPDAQCPGERRAAYAVLPFRGDPVEADVKGVSRRWRTPVLTRQGVEDQRRPGGVSFLEKTTKATAITAIRKHDVRDSAVVRLVNLTGDPVTEILRPGVAPTAAYRLDLEEERLGPLDPGESIAVDLGPFEIGCIELEFGA